MLKAWLHRRLWLPLKGLLRQGLSPEALARCLAAGVIVGICPVLGVSSVLAALVSWLFKLNPVGIQIANYAMYPVQFVLLVPFLQAGQWFFGEPFLHFHIPQMLAHFARTPGEFVVLYGPVAGRAAVVWALIGIPGFFVLSLLLRWPLQRAARSQRPAS